MSSRIALNLILLALVIGLSVFLLRTNHSSPAIELPDPVSTLNPDTINEIRLSRPGKPDMRLQKSDSGWTITEPIHIAANPYRISSLLELLQTVSISTVSADPAKLGLLDNPVTLSFDKEVFRFGSTSPLDNSRYIEHQNIIYLIEDRLYPQLIQDAEFFADPHLVQSSFRLQRIRLHELELTFKNDHWVQTSGTPLATDARADEIGNNWNQLVADRVSTGTGLNAELTVTLQPTNGEPVGLFVLSRDPELQIWRKDTGFIYHYPAQVTDALGLTQAAN